MITLTVSDGGRQASTQFTLTAANGETYVAAGDLDGDGRAEIVAGLGGGGQGWLHVFNDASAGYASLAWRQLSWASYNANASGGEVHPAVGDLDADGRAEIVAALGAYPGEGGWFEVFDDSAAGYARLGWFNTGRASVRTAGAPMFAAVGKFR